MGGERLPSPPRERKPALAALAVLLILVGALGATLMVMRAGDKVSVVEVVAPVAAGNKIPEGPCAKSWSRTSPTAPPS